MMRRREFITLLGGGAAAWPLAARAQQASDMRLIGVLMAAPENDLEYQSYLTTFRDALQSMGWAQNRNIRMNYRWGAVGSELLQRFARELIATAPDLIVSQSTPTTASLLQQTRTIPILFASHVDPVGSGLVASLSHPGGNVTGFLNVEPSIVGKWLELLKEIAPWGHQSRALVQPVHGDIRRNFL